MELGGLKVGKTGVIESNTRGKGKGGSIRITGLEGKESVVFEIEVAGKIWANAFGQGDGGSIEVGGQELKVYGRILSESIGDGKGGEIYLGPSDLLEIGGDRGNSSNNRDEISSVTNGA